MKISMYPDQGAVLTFADLGLDDLIGTDNLPILFNSIRNALDNLPHAQAPICRISRNWIGVNGVAYEVEDAALRNLLRGIFDLRHDAEVYMTDDAIEAQFEYERHGFTLPRDVLDYLLCARMVE